VAALAATLRTGNTGALAPEGSRVNGNGVVSFDIFLQRFVGGEPAEAHRVQVKAVLQANHHSGPDRYGFYVVSFPDGVDVELSAKGLDGSESFKRCAFHVRGMISQSSF
jgi:hypothetical protein